MQPLTMDVITSLDGFGAAADWPGWWGMEGPEYLEWLMDAPDRDHPIVMGTKTYRLMSGMAKESFEGADMLDPTPKYVFSSSLTEVDWANTTLVKGDAVEGVARLKQESDLPLRTLGSVSMCRSLLKAGLVDRYRVVVFPVVTGATGDERIYDGWPDVRLELVNSRLFDGRLQLMEFVPTVLERAPLAEAPLAEG